MLTLLMRVNFAICFHPLSAQAGRSQQKLRPSGALLIIGVHIAGIRRICAPKPLDRRNAAGAQLL